MATNDESMTSLKDIIGNLFGDGGLPFDPADANIWKVWEEVVGLVISESAQPSRIKNGSLRVTVSDPIWLQELEFMERDVRKKLNTRLGRKAIDRIEFRLGPN